MNANTRSELVALVQSGPTWFPQEECPPFPAVELTAVAIDIAENEVINDTALFADWLACEDNNRQPSAYFGPISTDELMSLYVLNPAATAEGVKAAGGEIRRRYIADKSELIQRKAQEAMNG